MSREGNWGLDMGAVGTESQMKKGEKISAEVAALCPWSERWGEERKGSGNRESCTLTIK